MAKLFADENFDFPVVNEVRSLGHDVVTALAAGRANQGLDDADQLAYATSQGRAVLTFNRRDFIRLHRTTPSHAGIIICTHDEAVALAARIDQAIQANTPLDNKLLRVNRPSK